MKLLNNILVEIAFYLVIPFVGIIYFIIDGYRAMKKRRTEPPYKPKSQNITTVYPPTKLDFNQWSKYIHKQATSHQ